MKQGWVGCGPRMFSFRRTPPPFVQSQPDFLTVINLNECVPTDHPLRAIKRHLDAVLQRLSPLFDALYEELGRPSIPPEQLLKARVLTALYTVRSERLFCEQLGYNLLWLWFLDREFAEGSFDHSVFAKNYERVLSADVAKLFLFPGKRAGPATSISPPTAHSSNRGPV